MLKLINFSVDPWDLDKFDNNIDNIRGFLARHKIDGFEMIQYANWDDCVVPTSLIHGAHTCFWPTWLDFWLENKEELLRQFGDPDICAQYYRCSSKPEMIDYYKREMERAAAAGVHYVVFHVSHIEMEHCYTYDFTYDDEEVTEAFIDMANQILEGADPNLEILFENHWYPGLTFLKKDIMTKIMTEIKHPKKGFVLDIGHLMNTNLNLRSEKEAVDYMVGVLDGLGEVAWHIKAIHLNSSLTGEYVKHAIAGAAVYDETLDFNTQQIQLYAHISKIDTHAPFLDASINKIIDVVAPKYLVYEFSVETQEALDDLVRLQNRILEETGVER